MHPFGFLRPMMGGLGSDPDGEWGAEDNLPFLLANPMDQDFLPLHFSHDITLTVNQFT